VYGIKFETKIISYYNFRRVKLQNLKQKNHWLWDGITWKKSKVLAMGWNHVEEEQSFGTHHVGACPRSSKTSILFVPALLVIEEDI
jgi:hypothetical protein